VKDIDLTREPYFAECHILCPPTPPIFGSLLSNLTPLGDRLLFEANDRTHGFAPWVSDGTAEGTRMLVELEQDANPDLIGAVPGAGLFWVSQGGVDHLWSTDGSESGTEPLAMPCDPSCSRWGESGFAFEDQLFFTAYAGGAQHTKLYRFDAVERETHEVFDLCGLVGSFCVRSVLEMVVWNGSLYFNVAVSGFSGPSLLLYRSPSLEAAPAFVANACGSNASLLPFGSQLLFVGNCGGSLPAIQASLYSLDAPDATPRLVHPFGDAGRLVAWGGDRAAFTAGGALWITDGTTAGTAPSGIEQALAFVALGETLLVSGTRAGVAGLYAVHRSGQITPLREGPTEEGPQVAGDVAFFSAEAPGLGVELWVTDGTPAGTRLYQDIAAGSQSSQPGIGGLEPTGFVAAGDRVFFAASDPQHDIELWAAPLDGSSPPPPPCVGSAEVLCLAAGRFRAEVSWRDFSGNTGRGRAVPLEEVTGAFWFFEPSNLELMVKTLDGTAVNGHHWVFYGALTNVEYTLTVTDTETGEVWTHHNPSGHFASGADTSAFPSSRLGGRRVGAALQPR
jgi:ELWxxDGT repeat protein